MKGQFLGIEALRLELRLRPAGEVDVDVLAAEAAEGDGLEISLDAFYRHISFQETCDGPHLHLSDDYLQRPSPVHGHVEGCDVVRLAKAQEGVGCGHQVDGGNRCHHVFGGAMPAYEQLNRIS